MSKTTAFARDAQYCGREKRRRDTLFSTCFRIAQTCEWSTGSPGPPCSPFICVVLLARSRGGSSQVAARGQRDSVISISPSYSFVLSSNAALDGRRPSARRIESATRHALSRGPRPVQVLVPSPSVSSSESNVSPTRLCHLDAPKANLPVLQRSPNPKPSTAFLLDHQLCMYSPIKQLARSRTRGEYGGEGFVLERSKPHQTSPALLFPYPHACLQYSSVEMDRSKDLSLRGDSSRLAPRSTPRLHIMVPVSK
ncbi:hypothetical protein F4678DRAFT_15297 [Xylaria arbuscula]|nr:hypothetical protein F4678DRAFT_15297 [Xylaria arbuscula]